MTTRRVLLAVVLLGLVAGCRNVSRGSSAFRASATPRGEQIDAVYAAVVRSVTKVTDLKGAKLFISVAGSDPSDSLLRHLEQNGYRAMPWSEVASRVATDVPLELSEVRWIGDSEAEVDGQQVFHKTAGRRVRYRLRLTDGRWHVTTRSFMWVS